MQQVSVANFCISMTGICGTIVPIAECLTIVERLGNSEA
jgi:hypothetical protein